MEVAPDEVFERRPAMFPKRPLITLLMTIAIALPVHAYAGNVPIDELPKAVVRAILDEFPDAQIREADRESVEGRTLYDVAIRSDDEDVAVIVTATGEILDVEG
jgi:hypothetical protein